MEVTKGLKPSECASRIGADRAGGGAPIVGHGSDTDGNTPEHAGSNARRSQHDGHGHNVGALPRLAFEEGTSAFSSTRKYFCSRFCRFTIPDSF